jgi:5-methylcytosine-specific restriction endonuclease McrA
MSIVGKIVRELKSDMIRQHYSDKNRLIPRDLYVRLKHKKYCDYCHKRMYHNELHHIIPISKGGENIESNLMSVHSECHKKLDGESK